MSQSEIPRWLLKDPVQLNNLGTDIIKPIKNVDLEAASAMYGKISETFFDIAYQQSKQISYKRRDFSELYASEQYNTGKEAIQKLRLDPEASIDGPTFRKNASTIINDATKGMGYFEAKETRRQLNNDIIDISQKITQEQINNSIALSQKQKQNDWDIKKQNYLTEIDPQWSPEETSLYYNAIKIDQRKSLNFLPEDQQEILDKQTEKEFRVYRSLNWAIKEDSFNDPKKREQFLKSEEVKKIFEDPETKDIANGVIKNVLSLQSSKLETAKLFDKFKVDSTFNQFQVSHDNIPSITERYNFFKKELLNARTRGETADYIQKLKNYGDTLGYGIPKAGFGFFTKTVGGEDEWFRMGLNSEVGLQYVDSLYINGSINRKQRNAAVFGLNQRDQAYNKFDKKFGEQVKAEFGIDLFKREKQLNPYQESYLAYQEEKGIELPGGKNNAVRKKLEEYIKEEKRALYGLKYNDYVKGLDNLLIRAKTRKIELEQERMQTFGNKPKEIKINLDYAR